MCGTTTSKIATPRSPSSGLTCSGELCFERSAGVFSNAAGRSMSIEMGGSSQLGYARSLSHKRREAKGQTAPLVRVILPQERRRSTRQSTKLATRMNTKITCETLPVLEIGLEAGDKIVAEPGEFSWMTQTVAMNTTAMTAGAKGIFGVLGRALSGGGLFMTEVHRTGRTGADRVRGKNSRPYHGSERNAGSGLPDPSPWLLVRHRRRRTRDGLSAFTRGGRFRRRRLRHAAFERFVHGVGRAGRRR